MMPDWMKPLRGLDTAMYLAYPTQIHRTVPGIGERLEDFAWKRGFAPVDPFLSGKFKHFEGGRVKRAGTIKWTLHLQRGLGWSGYFGISDGVMCELSDRLKWDQRRRMRIFFYDDDGVPFDPQWEEKYNIFQSGYGDLLAELRGPKQLLIFVGPSAVGKTFWMEQLKIECGDRLERVKTVTTRPPRDARDQLYYYQVSAEEFKQGMENFSFHEHKEYLNASYGSSLIEARRVLTNTHGMCALTPEGARAYYHSRFEMNVAVVSLQPASNEVLVNNLRRRGETDEAKIREKLERAKDFVVPADIPHQKIVLTGAEEDRIRVFDALLPLLK